MHRLLATGGAVAVLLLGIAWQFGGPSTDRGASARHVSSNAPAIPRVFEPNAGRTDARVDFLTRGPGYALWLTGRGHVVAFGHGKRGAVVRTTLDGVRDVRATGEARSALRVNSYIGNRRNWREGIPTFGKVRYRGIYPGTDLVYHSTDGALEYDFVLRPGASPAPIQTSLAGADRLNVDSAGNLVMTTHAGRFAQRKPVAYQLVDGARREVAAGYVLHGHRVGFRLGAYDRTKPLVIDPVLSYSTYAGGGSTDDGIKIAVDSTGAAYVTGDTLSSDFPPNPQTLTPWYNTFVLKIAPDGTTRPYITYFGSANANLLAADIAVDGTEAVVTGQAFDDFPATGGAYQTTNTTGRDAFLARLNTNGTVKWATYVGGNGNDFGEAVAINASGDAVLAASTLSSDMAVFPVLPADGGPVIDTTYNAGDAYLISFDKDGNRKFSTYVPGFGFPSGIAIRPSTGYIYMTGSGGGQAKYTRINPTGTSQPTNTSYGGDGTDDAYGIAAMPNGDAVIVGETTSSNFPTTGGTTGMSDGWYLKVFEFGATYWGARISSDTNFDRVTDVALDQDNQMYLSGYVGDSSSFPELRPLDGPPAGEAFFAKISTTVGGGVIRTTFGTPGTRARGIALDSNRSAYLVGQTSAGDFPVSTGGQGDAGGDDAFVAKITAKPVGVSPTSIAPTAQATQTFTLTPGDPGQRFECKLDSDPSAVCTSPKQVTPLADGEHTFSVRPVDPSGLGSAQNGNSPMTESYTTVTWTLDRGAPNAFALRSPDDGASGIGVRPAFSWDQASDSLSDVTTYRVLVGGTKVAEVGPDACSTGACSATAGSDLTVGQHTWKVEAVDQAGNVKTSAERTFTVVLPPTAKLTVSPNPALVGSTVTFDGSASADAVHSISRHQWDLDGDGTFESDTGPTPTTTKAYAAPVSINVSLLVTDAQGSTATTSVPLRVTALPTIPGQFGVSVNKGAQYTRTPDVTVTAVYPSTTTSLLFSNDGGFFAPTQFAPAREIKWKLDSSGPERLPKIVYVRFLNGPIVGETRTDDIILDETPPKVDQATLSAPPATGVRSAAAKKRTYALKVKASDSNSGVSKLQVTSNKKKPGKLLKYARKFNLKSTARPKYIRARDRAGNLSRWRKLR